MRKLLWLPLLLLALPAHAQVRFGDGQPVISAQVSGGPLYSVPFAVINFCGSPNVSVPCVNKVTTYTDATLLTACPTSKQVVLAGTNTCTGTTDLFGNWGVWVPAGTYTYTIQIPGGGSLGPYTVTLASGGGGGGSPGPPGTSLQYNNNGVFGGVTGSSYNNITGALNLPLIGNPFIKPGASDAICYVSTNGNDANDGLSWGSAKLTIRSCIVSLPGGSTSPDTAGKGVVYMTNNAAAHPTSGCGIWIMGSNDPNFASPPTCWIKTGSVSQWSLSIIGVPQVGSGPNPHLNRAILSGGSNADINHPGIWLSAIPGTLDFENLAIQFPGRGIVIGEDSNHGRTGLGGVSATTFYNVTSNLASVSGNGPDWDITGNSIWLWLEHCGAQGLGAVNTPTNDNAAAILIDGRGNVGNGLIFISDLNMAGGGIKFYAGTNVGTLTVHNATVESASVPMVWFVTQPTNAELVGLSTADSSAILAVENDGIGSPDQIIVENVNVNNGSTPPTQGPMLTFGFAANTSRATIISPTRQQQEGFLGGKIIGQHDSARRLFSPMAVRFTNLATMPPVTSSGSGTVTTGITSPDGTTGAVTVAATAGTYIADFYSQNITPAVGEWEIAGAWVRANTSAGFNSGINPLQIVLSGTNTISGRNLCFTPWLGDGDWQWVYCAVKVLSATGTSNLALDAFVNFSPLTTTSYYGPVLLRIPPSTISDNEAWEIALHLQSYGANAPIGSIAGLPGQFWAFPGSTNFYGLFAHANTANRTYTFPDTTGTVALLNLAQTFSAVQTFTLAPVFSTMAGGGVQCVQVNNLGQESGTGSSCGAGGGGSSIFAQYQFGSNTALVGPGLYIQLTAPAMFNLTQTGAGTVGSPYIDTFAFASQAAGTVLGNATGASAVPTFTANPVLGLNASVPGSLGIANGSATGQTITIQNLGATAAFNFNLPITAGTANFVLASGGGGLVNMIWTSNVTAINGTNCSLGGSCTAIQLQAKTVNLSSQSLLNLVTSATNQIGISLTPTNTSGGIVQYEAAGTTNAFGGGTGLSSPLAHSFVIAEGASPYNLITSPTVNGFYACGFNVTSSVAVDPICTLEGVPITNSTGASVTLNSLVDETLQTFSNSGAIAVTGPPVANNISFALMPTNTGGITYTPASGQVNGASTQLIPAGWFALHYTDNSLTRMPTMPTTAAFPNTGANTALTFNSTTDVLGTIGSLVTGPVSSVNLDLACFNGTGGLTLSDCGVLSTNVVTDAGTATSGQVMFGAGTKVIQSSANLTFSGSTLNLGKAGATGILNILGTTSGTVSFTVNAVAGTWTATWPATAGTNLQVLTTDGTGILSWTSAAGGGTVGSCGTTGAVAVYTAATTTGCGNADFTYATHTLTAGASGLVDFSAMSTTNGFKLPSGAGAVPTADGFISVNTTNHDLVWGSSGSTFVGAIAATGTGTATTCTNQVITAISAVATPTCTTIALSFLPTQGTDTNLLTSGTISGGAATPLCLDANSGATTVGCLFGQSTASGSYWMAFTVSFVPSAGVAATFSQAINVPEIFEFNLPIQAKVTEITFNIIAAAAASTGDLGMYNSSGTLVWHTGSITTTSTGVQTITITTATLNPGQYYWASCESSVSVTATSITTTATAFGAIMGAANSPAHSWGNDATDTCTAGVLPGTITTTNITNQTGNGFVPIMAKLGN